MNRLAFLFLLAIPAFASVACAPGASQPSTIMPVSEPAGVTGESEMLSPVAQATNDEQEATTVESAADLITLPLSVYIIDDDEGQLSSGRSAEQLAGIYQRVNDIWSQAGIVIYVRSIQRVSLPFQVVESITAGEFQPFLDGAGRDFDIPEPSLLNAFYAQQIGGPNGIAPFGTRLFLVTDVPSVHHERVSSHEIGHILGLHHTLLDRERLLFPGSNGQGLTAEEIVVARYVAQGLLDRQR